MLEIDHSPTIFLNFCLKNETLNHQFSQHINGASIQSLQGIGKVAEPNSSCFACSSSGMAEWWVACSLLDCDFSVPTSGRSRFDPQPSQPWARLLWVCGLRGGHGAPAAPIDLDPHPLDVFQQWGGSQTGWRSGSLGVGATPSAPTPPQWVPGGLGLCLHVLLQELNSWSIAGRYCW